VVPLLHLPPLPWPLPLSLFLLLLPASAPAPAPALAPALAPAPRSLVMASLALQSALEESRGQAQAGVHWRDAVGG